MKCLVWSPWSRETKSPLLDDQIQQLGCWKIIVLNSEWLGFIGLNHLESIKGELTVCEDQSSTPTESDSCLTHLDFQLGATLKRATKTVRTCQRSFEYVIMWLCDSLHGRCLDIGPVRWKTHLPFRATSFPLEPSQTLQIWTTEIN